MACSPTTDSACCSTAGSPGTLTSRHGSEAGHTFYDVEPYSLTAVKVRVHDGYMVLRRMVLPHTGDSAASAASYRMSTGERLNPLMMG